MVSTTKKALLYLFKMAMIFMMLISLATRDYSVHAGTLSTFTLYVNDGTSQYLSATINTGDTSISSITNPTRQGYTFNGWTVQSYSVIESYDISKIIVFPNGKLNSKFTDPGFVDANGCWESAVQKIDLFAFWTPNQYTITLNGNGGTLSTTSFTAVYKSNQHTQIQDPERTGYTFTGWSAQANGTTAIIDPNPVVTYTSSYAIGSDNYTDANHSWIKESDCTLYAMWQANTYTITLSANGGNSNSSATATYGQNALNPASLEIPTRSNYTFGGWTDENDASKLIINAQGQLVSGVSGYTDSEGKWIYSDTTPLTLYAKWSTVQYTVTFENTGDSQIPAQSVDYNSYATEPNATPQKTGFTFLRWSESENGSTSFSFTTSKITGNKTIYAVWSTNQYSFTLYGNGGTWGTETSQTATTSYNDTQFISSSAINPTRKGYNFAGWATDQAGNNKIADEGTYWIASIENYTDASREWIHDGAVDLYAVWTPITYTVSFDGNTGHLNTSTCKVIYNGTMLTGITNPTKSNYTFAGWTRTQNGTDLVADALGTLAKNVTDYTDADGKWIHAANNSYFYAKWTANTYLITLDGNDGVLGTASATAQYNSSTLTTITNPTRTGYSFGGWTTVKDGTSIVISVDGALQSGINGFTDGNGNWTKNSATTVYASWIPNEYTVSFDTSKNGSIVSSQTIKFNSKATKPDPNPTRTGYNFSGWFDAADGGTAFDFDTMKITDNTTIYAHWTAKMYSVTLNVNGGTGMDASISATYGASTIIGNFPATTKTGLTLIGWTATKDGTDIIINRTGKLIASTDYTDASANWTKDDTVVLYAKWENLPLVDVVFNFLDTDTNANDLTKYTQTVSAVSGIDNDVDLSSAISALETLNYKIDSAVPATVNGKTLSYTLKVSHKKNEATVTSDTYTVKRTIKYHLPGETTMNSVVQEGKYTIVTTSLEDLVTGKKMITGTTYNTIKGFDEFVVPVVEGYISNPISYAAVKSFNADNAVDITDTVEWGVDPAKQTILCIEGNNQIVPDELIPTSGITIKFNGLKKDVIRVAVNGIQLTEGSDYVLNAGSTIVTLSNSYLKTLPDGKYTLEVYYNTQTTAATAEFTVTNPKIEENENSEQSANTGDITNTGLWEMNLMISIACIISALLYKRKFESQE